MSIDKALQAVVPDEVPGSVLPRDGDLGAVGELSQDLRIGGGLGADVQAAALGADDGGSGGLWVAEGHAKPFRHGHREVPGDGLDVRLDPFRVGGVVVVGDFHQNGGCAGVAQLVEGGGGQGPHLGRVGVDFLEAHQDIIFYETTSEIILDASMDYVEYEWIY